MAKRVLVADDSATIQKAFAMVFAGQDVSLIPARSLDEAISAARQGRPDLVIADANLGGRSGYELCAAVKSDPGLRGVPVYILASTHTPYDEGRGREAGADGQLQKPFESQGIIDKVTEILGRAAPLPAPAAAPAAKPAPAPARAAVPVASAARPPARDGDDDDYGEVIIERSPSRSGPSPLGQPVASAAPASPGLAAPAGTLPGLRPSLIPGARPGAVPRPASSAAALASSAPANTVAPPRPAPSFAAPAPPVGAMAPLAPQPAPTGAPAPGAAAGVGRTMMGMPAVMIPGVPRAQPAPSSSPAPTPGMAPARAPMVTPVPIAPAAAVPAPAATPAPALGISAFSTPALVPPAAATPSASAAVSARLDQKMSALAARGPEYEAIAKLSREVIEEIVWEVVPELAEIIIREHVERHGLGKK